MHQQNCVRVTGRLAAAAAASVALAGGVTRSADASLIIDVRAVAYNGSALPPGSSGKTVFAGPGDVVTLKLFAQITGTNGINDETVNSVHGIIVSGGDGLGNLT